LPIKTWENDMAKNILAGLLVSATIITSSVAQDEGIGATGVYTDAQGNETVIPLPDVPDVTPIPADEHTQELMEHGD
jgi:hypothetical protein